MARELIRLPVDVMVTDGQKSAVVAHEATRTILIVMEIVGDPLAAGVTGSFAHPGGNVTGFTLLSVELSAKRLEVLKEPLPAILRVVALWNPASPASHRQAAGEGARTLGVELRTIEVTAPDEISGGFAAAVADGAEGLVVLPDAMFWNHRGQIVALAAQHRIPAIYDAREYADDGGLISYGPNGLDNFRRAAGYVDKVLKGANPGDLPIQQPTKFELVVNLKAAKALALTIPPAILAREDEVIE
jgi:putative ABC transport system substrate-binding protein